jgi:hypothetical protein
MKAFLYSEKFREWVVLTIFFTFYMISAWVLSSVTGSSLELIVASFALIKALKMEIRSVQ